MMTQSKISINHPLSRKLDGESVATTTNLPTISMAMADQHHDKQGMVTSHKVRKDFRVELSLIYNILSRNKQSNFYTVKQILKFVVKVNVEQGKYYC